MKNRQFKPGDKIFARWHGHDLLEIVEEHKTEKPLRHWICKIQKGKICQYWTIPQIHMLSESSLTLLKDGNRKQLSLF